MTLKYKILADLMSLRIGHKITITLPEDMLDSLEYYKKIIKDSNYTYNNYKEKLHFEHVNSFLEKYNYPTTPEARQFFAEVYIRSAQAIMVMLQ